MSRVAVLEQQIGQLDPPEREELIGRLTGPRRESPLLYPSIVSTPGVCGGSARIIRTRIPVWTLVRMQQLGTSEADILRSYPSLRAVDLVQAWAYADLHREEIEREIRENEEE